MMMTMMMTMMTIGKTSQDADIVVARRSCTTVGRRQSLQAATSCVRTQATSSRGQASTRQRHARRQRSVAFVRKQRRRGTRQGPSRRQRSVAFRCKQRRRRVRLRSAGAFASAAQRCVLSLNAQMLPQRKCRRHRRMFNTFLQNGYEMMTKPCILLLEQTQTK